jgi:hypothetical protein
VPDGLGDSYQAARSDIAVWRHAKEPGETIVNLALLPGICNPIAAAERLEEAFELERRFAYLGQAEGCGRAGKRMHHAQEFLLAGIVAADHAAPQRADVSELRRQLVREFRAHAGQHRFERGSIGLPRGRRCRRQDRRQLASG